MCSEPLVSGVMLLSYMDDVFRRLSELMKRLSRELGFPSEIGGESEYASLMEELFRDRMRMASNGVIEPMISVFDRGDHLVIVVDLPGAKEGTVDIRLYEDRLEVSSEIDESLVREAFQGYFWASRIKRFRGSYTLPCPVDPSTARIERKGSRILIYVRKKK